MRLPNNVKYPNFKEEKILWRQGFKCVAGLDEAGRGPLAGPVVAGAVLIKINNKYQIPKIFNGVNDSKKLSEKKRNYFYKIITNHKNIKWGIGIVSEKVIDKINILEATKLAMQKAICDANIRMHTNNTNKKINYLLIDGNFGLNIDLPQKSVIKGDQKVFSISAASIIAKVTRDRIMQKFHKKYPQYRFDKHKGYPTGLHVKMLKKIGACPIHRKSFGPVARLSDN